MVWWFHRKKSVRTKLKLKPSAKSLAPRGEIPIVSPHSVQVLSKASYIALPSEWTRLNKIKKGQRLLVIADRSVLIVHPKDERTITKAVGDLVKKHSPKLTPK